MWWNFLLKNKHYAKKSRDVLGTDSAGVLRVFEQWGALLFRPQKVVREMIGAVEDAMIPGAYRVGIHVRIGGNWYDQADLFNGMTGRSPLLAERAAGCALSTLPTWERSRPVNYLVISDKAVGKKGVVSALERSEAGPNAEKRRMGDAEVQEAIGIVNETHKKWLSVLDVTGWDLGRGSRAVVIGSFGTSSDEGQGSNASRNTTLDIQQALAEMFVLGQVDSLIRTTDSSFSIVAYSFRSHRHDYPPSATDGTWSRQKETWYVEDGGGDHWCHKQHSSEPQVRLSTMNLALHSSEPQVRLSTMNLAFRWQTALSSSATRTDQNWLGTPKIRCGGRCRGWLTLLCITVAVACPRRLRLTGAGCSRLLEVRASLKVRFLAFNLYAQLLEVSESVSGKSTGNQVCTVESSST